MSTLIPVSATRRDRSVSLATVERGTAVQQLQDRSQSVIASNRLREIDHVVRDAITGQAVLSHWAQHLAGSDPLLQDELHYFVKLARLAKGEVIAGLVDDYSGRGVRR